MTSLLAALQFLTIFPALIKREFRAQELGRAVALFPLVGLGLGAVLFGSASLAQRFFPAQIVAILTLALWLILTRALHFDGFLDICDGLFGGFTPERRLEIMRDSRVGAFAVAGGSVLLLAKFSAIQALPDLRVLLLAPVLGRWAISLAVIGYPYVRIEGMGRAMKDHAAWPHALLSSFLAAASAWFFFQTFGLLALLISALILLLFAAFILRRIPGLSGDAYGAICEIVELAVLLTFVARSAA